MRFCIPQLTTNLQILPQFKLFFIINILSIYPSLLMLSKQVKIFNNRKLLHCVHREFIIFSQIWSYKFWSLCKYLMIWRWFLQGYMSSHILINFDFYCFLKHDSNYSTVAWFLICSGINITSHALYVQHFCFCLVDCLPVCMSIWIYHKII